MVLPGLGLAVLLFAGPPPTPTPAMKPAGASLPVAKVAPAKAPGPVVFRTKPFEVTGTGALASRGPFKPVSVTTAPFAATGTGALAARAPYTPKTFTTSPLTVTGTGAR
jgi:hypothetical protein